MREDGGDGAATVFLPRDLGTPRASVQLGENELVHGVVDRVGVEQGIANPGEGRIGLECHVSPRPSMDSDDGANRVVNKIKKAASGCLCRNFPRKDCTSDGALRSRMTGVG